MNIEAKVKDLILNKYKTLKNFATFCGLPYGTVDGILRRGFANSNLENVLTMCRALGISADELADGNIVYSTTQPKVDVSALVSLSSPVYLDGVQMTDDEISLLSDLFELSVEVIRKRRNH